MAAMYDTWLAFFSERGWEIHPFGDGIALSLTFQGDDDRVWSCVAQGLEDPPLFLFYSVGPDVPPSRRSAIAEWSNLVNYQLYVGNFEIDPSDGDFRFATALGVGGMKAKDVEGPIVRQLLGRMVDFNLLTMNDRLPAIDAVITGEMDAETASTVTRSDD